jgi:trk system potassium uptake protein TrkA
MNKRKNVLVVGLGRFGAALAGRLVELRHRVVGVDKVRSRVEEMADRLDLAAQLDASDEEALVKVGAREMDLAVVAIGEGVEASVLATAILRDLGIPRIVARAIGPLHARVLQRVGAHKVISPEHDMGLREADLLTAPWMARFTALDEGDLLVGEAEPLPEMLGHRLADLQFTKRYGAMVLLVERNGGRLLPRAETEIAPGDRLWIAGRREDLARWVPEEPTEF